MGMGTPLRRGEGVWECPSPEKFLIWGSQNMYFVAFSGPPESDSVGLVPATFC